MGLTASQLDLPSLTELFVAACGRLQLEAAYWATSVSFLQVVENLPHGLSTGKLLAIEDFILYFFS